MKTLSPFSTACSWGFFLCCLSLNAYFGHNYITCSTYNNGCLMMATTIGERSLASFQPTPTSNCTLMYLFRSYKDDNLQLSRAQEAAIYRAQNLSWVHKWLSGLVR